MRQGCEFILMEKGASAANVASELRKIGINDACFGVSACAYLHMSVRKLVAVGSSTSVRASYSSSILQCFQ